jgi:hypothetical protein
MAWTQWRLPTESDKRYILVPIYSTESDEFGEHEIIGWYKEYVR